MMKENFIQFIDNSIKKNWSQNSFADYKGESMTYAELAERIARLHLVFDAFDVKKGDKVALFGKNTTHQSVAYMAFNTYGAGTVSILPDFKPNDVHHIVNHSDSVLMFACGFLMVSVPIPQFRSYGAKILSITVFATNISHLRCSNTG